MKKVALVLVAVSCLAPLACGGRTVTERNMLEWCPILNTYMATNMEQANAFPDSLDDLPPMTRSELKTTDGWGNRILYRKLRIDLYNLISAGPDGQFGNDDDIVIQNGALYEPAKVYAEWPIRQ